MHPMADTGRVIAGRYRLQAPIGRGAMGVVWRARDQLLDRDVAVKEVHIADTLTDAERANAYHRTMREAKTAARLNHPAVVTVYDVCEDEGRPWIVMQLVSALSLDQVLAASGPLSPRRAAEMARQLLSALSMAHAAGVLHRDVKPSNVLLGRDDRAVLTDFGIATFAGDPRLTQTGMVMGSPGFTAPERIRGADASPASDLWSLGATLFAAVEGHGPYERRGGAMTTMSAIINEDAPEAPTAGALGPVIAALLRREPADRPDAAGAMRMITGVLPQLPDGPTGAAAGYEPTALSAASRPGSGPPGSGPPASGAPGSGAPASGAPGSGPPGSFLDGSARPGPAAPGSAPPGSAAPGETSPNLASAEPTIAGAALGMSPSSGAPADADAQTAPTAPQPVQGHPPRYDQPGGGWDPGAGYAATAGPEVQPEVPPRPDFSSWYDPSPRAAPSPRSTGPTPPGEAAAAWYEPPSPGSAYRSPSGYGPPPGAGSASQPPAGSASWSPAGAASWPGGRPGHAPARRRRSGLGWKAVAVILALVGAIAGAATVVLLRHDHSSASPAPGTTLPPAQLVVAIDQLLTGPAPVGYRNYRQPPASGQHAGFSIDIPANWTTSEDGASQTTYLTDPGANTSMVVDLTPHTYADMAQEARYIESTSSSRFPGYQRVDLRALTIRGTPGAFWKFTWLRAGVPQTALDLLFILNTSSGQQSYALYATAPSSVWQRMQPVFDEELRSFAPLPG